MEGHLKALLEMDFCTKPPNFRVEAHMEAPAGDALSHRPNEGLFDFPHADLWEARVLAPDNPCPSDARHGRPAPAAVPSGSRPGGSQRNRALHVDGAGFPLVADVGQGSHLDRAHSPERHGESGRF
jgi:hypothetical protein